jgi:hypothetical protein
VHQAVNRVSKWLREGVERFPKFSKIFFPFSKMLEHDSHIVFPWFHVRARIGNLNKSCFSGLANWLAGWLGADLDIAMLFFPQSALASFTCFVATKDLFAQP